MKTSIFRSPSCSRFMEHAFERDWLEVGAEKLRTCLMAVTLSSGVSSIGICGRAEFDCVDADLHYTKR